MRIISQLLIGVTEAEKIRTNALEYIQQGKALHLAIEVYDLAQSTSHYAITLINRYLKYKGDLN